MRPTLESLIQNIQPFDALEVDHIQDTLEWIRSGAPVYRLQKPDIPPKHLVSYFVVVDETARKVLLVNHIKAQRWLPAGGHVEPDEHPRVTVERECEEELGIKAEFMFDAPFFLTSTVTVGLTAGHMDVSLWYVLKGRVEQPLSYDPQEFHGIKWFNLDALPEKTDPHMKRFVKKLSLQLKSAEAA